MPLRVDPQTAAQEWSRGLGNATEKITRGVQRVSTSPGAKAAAKSEKWLQNVQAAHDKFKRNVGRVSLSEWQEATVAAVSRVAQGAAMKEDKFATRIAPVFQHMAGVLNQVDGMPDTTLDQRINKSAAFQRGMAQYRSPAGG